MYRIEEDLKEELSKQDYYSEFIRATLRDLKKDGICYVFNKSQLEEILKYVNDVEVIKNEIGYTINIPRNKRKEKYNDTM